MDKRSNEAETRRQVMRVAIWERRQLMQYEEAAVTVGQEFLERHRVRRRHR
eukprot:CAMPEP_0173398592 /NCGR_PEP_ID=MMETSP1356-20130122/42147_1 /TAXON_ID=77927 ORGANISM="Hemiselmis virescens, Strain PCC157" /NCGR_SAMPLE_ID=MMETSP1356 /ASSEMBLY_ACC=CAM_ASM_000847 /LENGTH=50 /DNA_ID=CAMNT_0014358115 /DNA_START=79 /DNA_END=228 /DNA_ORIENTATION=-